MASPFSGAKVHWTFALTRFTPSAPLRAQLRLPRRLARRKAPEKILTTKAPLQFSLPAGRGGLGWGVLALRFPSSRGLSKGGQKKPKLHIEACSSSALGARLDQGGKTYPLTTSRFTDQGPAARRKAPEKQQQNCTSTPPPRRSERAGEGNSVAHEPCLRSIQGGVGVGSARSLSALMPEFASFYLKTSLRLCALSGFCGELGQFQG